MRVSSSFLLALAVAGAVAAKEHIGAPAPVAVVSPAEVVRGTMTDARNHMRYNTVKIGTQTWMAENLDYPTKNSWCYGDDSESCEKSGRLYDWDAAKTACPEGWHLPDDAAWQTLERSVGGRDTAGSFLKAPRWQGCDSSSMHYGFDAIPGGVRGFRGDYQFIAQSALFWSATEAGPHLANVRFLVSGDDSLNREFEVKSSGLSVRCLKN